MFVEFDAKKGSRSVRSEMFVEFEWEGSRAPEERYIGFRSAGARPFLVPDSTNMSLLWSEILFWIGCYQCDAPNGARSLAIQPVHRRLLRLTNRDAKIPP